MEACSTRIRESGVEGIRDKEIRDEEIRDEGVGYGF
jgi:hypothetical protein